MGPIEDFMADDHKRCDALYVEAERLVDAGDWQAAAAAYADFHLAMERHFAMEEEVLFPEIEQSQGGPVGPTQVMRMEHRQMRELFSALAEAAAEEDPDAFLGHAETLLILMQQHNAKEEQILYSLGDRLLPQAPATVVRMQELSGP